LLSLGKADNFPVLELGLQQPQQGGKRGLDAAVGCCREEQQVAIPALRQLDEEFVALLLDPRRAGVRRGSVRLIDNDKFGRVLQELGTMHVALDVVDADDNVGKVSEDALGGVRQLTFQPAYGARPDDLAGKAELVLQLLFPLVAEMGRAKDAGAGDLAAVDKLPGDQQCFNGLPDTHVVRDEHADRVEPQRHEQRDELIRPRSDADSPERAEGTGGIAEREPGGIEEQRGGGSVAGARRIGQRKLGRFDTVEAEIGQAPVDAGDLLFETGQRTEQIQLIVRGWQNDPLAIAAAHDRADRDC
jgi:hypothetical protein